MRSAEVAVILPAVLASLVWALSEGFSGREVGVGVEVGKGP
jgi:hypothetical protein